MAQGWAVEAGISWLAGPGAPGLRAATAGLECTWQPRRHGPMHDPGHVRDLAGGGYGPGRVLRFVGVAS
jgi:hypothetical protein